eukprot:11620286-Karenia_brevis.AAC.1
MSMNPVHSLPQTTIKMTLLILQYFSSSSGSGLTEKVKVFDYKTAIHQVKVFPDNGMSIA